MKDLHSHLLFGIDDGSKSLDESICLLKKMQEQNITDLICTPHYIENSKYVCNNKDKLKKIKKLKEKIQEENININLYLGNELFITPNVVDDSIIGSDVKPFYHGVSMKNHRDALQDMLNDKIKRGYKGQETIFHSDQGVIYSSVAFNNAHKDYNIKRSMSRIGTPTDNPIIESKNGWLKKEMYIDFNQENYDTVEEYIDAIIYDHNYLRPSYALNYKTPIEYRTQLGFK